MVAMVVTSLWAVAAQAEDLGWYFGCENKEAHEVDSSCILPLEHGGWVDGVPDDPSAVRLTALPVNGVEEVEFLHRGV